MPAGQGDLHLKSLWDRNIAITMRLVDTVSIRMLFKTVCPTRSIPSG
jgi:alcohol dehydrogenase